MTDAEIRGQLQVEFDRVFLGCWPFGGSFMIPNQIVFLSAPWDETKSPADDAYEMSGENVARAMYSVLLWFRYGRTAKIVLDGETEQLPAMEGLVAGFGAYPDMLVSVNSGHRGKSHSGTQFVELNKYLSEDDYHGESGLVLVTNQYHVPRVRRYAIRYLPSWCHWEVAGVPNDTGLYNKEKKVSGEIDRIIRYAKDSIFDLFPDLGEGNS